MKINDYILKIKKLGACSEAIEAAHQYETSQKLWEDCDRGDWMLWLIGKLSGEPGSDKRKRLVLAACKCARLALKLVPEGEKRPLRAIETAEKWARGEGNVTIKDVRAAAADAAAAAAAADATAYAADAAAAAAAADATAYAADAAAAAYDAAAAYAAAYAAYAAYAAAYAAYAADAAAYAAAYAYAADAAYAAAYAADAAAYAAAYAYAARKTTLKECADIVRKDYPDVDDLLGDE